MSDVPRTLAELTPEWLTHALDTTVTSVEVTAIAEGEGFMGRLARLALTYPESPDAAMRPATLVAKLPTDDPGSVALGQMLRVWEREARFYLDLAPLLPVRTPRCYYADGDEASGIFAMLLEDLSPYTGGNQVAGASPAQATAAIEWLGRFHGAASTDGLGEGLTWLPATATDPMYQGLQPMLEAVFPLFADKFGALTPAGTLSWAERLVPRLSEMLTTELLPLTIVHADFRVDNLFFDGDDVIALDWQAVAYGEGLYDVAYFLCGSVDTEQRRATERDLLTGYARSLRTQGIEVPGDDEVFDHYRRTVLLAMAVGALLMGQLDLTINQRAKDLAELGVSRLYTAGADLNVGELIED